MFGFDLVLVSKKQNSESTCKLSCPRILYSDPFWTQTGLMIQDIVRQKLMAFQFPSAMCLLFRTSIGKVRFLTLIIIMNISFQFLEWGCDDLTIYYSRPDEQNRPFAVLMHKTCQSVLTDVVLHEEKDER